MRIALRGNPPAFFRLETTVEYDIHRSFPVAVVDSGTQA
jgi:hypothetical protein